MEGVATAIPQNLLGISDGRSYTPEHGVFSPCAIMTYDRN